MLAHSQGGVLNASKLASGLSVTSPTVGSYLGLLVDLLLVRRLAPYHRNIGKRLVKSPKTYIRDSGLLHALLGIGDFDTLLGHPVIGTSLEGFVIENLLAVAPPHATASFYRTARGAEIDLVLEMGGKHGIWAVEIKHSPSASLQKGNRIALDDIQPSKVFLVHSGSDRFPKGEVVESIGLAELMQESQKLTETNRCPTVSMSEF